MNDILKRLELKIKSHELWHHQDALYVACSGGVDSVVLVHLLLKLGYKPTLLHCNYHLRGEESNRDEEFVRTLAKKFQIEILVNSFDTNSWIHEMGKGIQETARILRYKWFDEVLRTQSTSNAYLLTAHHRDDQVEGLLMNFFRGTGIAGMKGMQEKRGKIIRPLLDFSRQEISAYAHENKIFWVEDSSNAEVKYTRNLFRNELIPQIEKVYPSFQDNLIQNAKRFAEIETIYRKAMDRIIKKLIQPYENGFKIPVNLIRNTEALETILFEIFSTFDFSPIQSAEIKKLFDAETGRFMVSATHRVLKNRDWLLIEPIESTHQELILIQRSDSHVDFGKCSMKIYRTESSTRDQEKTNAYIDAQGIEYPLILRKWKNGDYFYPLGMKKKKKVSKFMTDIKLSRTEKENQWVIESNKKIIWVVGQRIDERFKITEKTKEILCFKL